jgi:hypothetical protein
MTETFKLSASALGGCLARKWQGAEDLIQTFALRPTRHFRLIGNRNLDAKNDKSCKEASDPKPNKPVHRIALRVAIKQRSRSQYNDWYHRSAPWIFIQLWNHGGMAIRQHTVCKTPQHKMPQQYQPLTQARMTNKPTQQQRVLEVLQSLRGEHDIPSEYIRHHAQGDGVSARYFKQVMLISEVNGRISELRAKGNVIETSNTESL